MAISVELSDDMTVGNLRALAAQLGRSLVISFGEAAAAPRRGRRPGRPAGRRAAAPAGAKPRKRRKLSPEAKAKLVANLVKARAARSANAKAKRKAEKGS